MSQAQVLHVLGWLWALFGMYWLIAARRGKTARSGESTSESPAYRLARLLLLAITFALLFAKWTAVGFLGQRFLPDAPSIACIGLALALAGMAIAMWARIHLGQYWSDKVVLKVDHQLIGSGPYARMRHPIYSGVLLGVAGTALVVGEWRGVLAFLLLLTNYAVKANREEKILAGAFAESFPEHKRRAGFLLPRLYPKK
jgi:protein-S-isoprenylcysteine O-methyltransferase Ste14